MQEPTQQTPVSTGVLRQSISFDAATDERGSISMSFVVEARPGRERREIQLSDAINYAFAGMVAGVANAAEQVREAVEVVAETGRTFSYSFRPAISTCELDLSEGTVRADLYSILERCSVAEAYAIRLRLQQGKLDGRTGSTCVFGVIAAMRGSGYGRLGMGESRYRPLEMWLTRVHIGCTPEYCSDAAMLDKWLADWLDKHPLDAIERHTVHREVEERMMWADHRWHEQQEYWRWRERYQGLHPEIRGEWREWATRREEGPHFRSAEDVVRELHRAALLYGSVPQELVEAARQFGVGFEFLPPDVATSAAESMADVLEEAPSNVGVRSPAEDAVFGTSPLLPAVRLLMDQREWIYAQCRRRT
jgi:plasmid stability protein